MTEYMLTTTDNPFDPFTEFEPWFLYDTQAGYHTCAYLARIVISSDDLSDADQALDNERAMDEIIAEHGGGIYKKVAAKTTTS